MSIRSKVRLTDIFYKTGQAWQATKSLNRIIDTLEAVAARQKDAAKKEILNRQISRINEQIQIMRNVFDGDGFKRQGDMLEAIAILQTSKIEDFVEVFARYCSPSVKEVVFYENSLITKKHIHDLRKLTQIFVNLCPNLRQLRLKCRKSTNKEELKIQKELLLDFQKGLERICIRAEIELESVRHTLKIVVGTSTVFCVNGYSSPEEPNVLLKRVEVWSTNYTPPLNVLSIVD